MRTILIAAVLGVLAQIITGCATLPPLKNEIPLAGSDITLRSQDPNLTKLIIFNSAPALTYLGRHKMNVYLDGKGVAQLGSHKYVQLILPRGKYKVDLVYVHDFILRSSHIVEMTGSESYLEVFPTFDSSRARLVPQLPQNFTNDFEPTK